MRFNLGFVRVSISSRMVMLLLVLAVLAVAAFPAAAQATIVPVLEMDSDELISNSSGMIQGLGLWPVVTAGILISLGMFVFSLVRRRAR